VGCKEALAISPFPAATGFTLTMWDVKIEKKEIQIEEVRVLP